jgi:ATP-dependent DNA ligase
MMLAIVEPIIPRPAHELPGGRVWRYEVKLDGFRGTLYIDRGRAQFRSNDAYDEEVSGACRQPRKSS